MLLRLLRGLTRARARPAAHAATAAPAPDANGVAVADWLKRGRALEAQGRLGAALECYRACAASHPRAVNAHLAAAAVLAALWRTDECLEALATVNALLPYALEPFSDYLLWTHLAAYPDPAAILRLHRRFGEIASATVPATFAGRHAGAADPSRVLRVGYVSRNFLRHSVAFFIEPVIANHDRTRFQVYCYYTHTVIDETTERIAALADAWRHVPDEDDAALAQRIHDDAIDILVDLAGHTKQNRLGVFARCPAPVQITGIGYPDTTGVDAIGYRLTDAVADPPPAADARHTERLLRVGPPFLCYAPPADSPPVALRESVAATVFGSFNMLAKVNARAIELWGRILREVPHSTLMLKSSALAQPETAERVLCAFEARGIARERIELRGWAQERAQHLAAYGEIDIALDTFPYNGTTTTCEALWMGVPVVVLAGEAHMSRVGASLLASVGLQGLVASNEDEYVSLAVDLARDPARRSALRSSMRERLKDSPLLDAKTYTRGYETRLREAWADWCEAQARL